MSIRRWILLAVFTILTALAARPLLSLEQFFYSDDGLLHLFRVFALDRTLHQGVVYPRWVSDLAYGYGYPIFNFYPPLSAYVIETLHLLGLGFPEAVKGAFVATIAIAVIGAYAMGVELLGREKNAQAIGILTATAYVFFPYFLTDIYVRGAIAETLAAALLPWLVWALRRALTRQTLGALLLVALLSALLLLAHSLTLFIAAPVLILFGLLELFRLPAAMRSKAITGLAISGVIGIGLGAIYWLPFVVELPLVKMGQGIEEIKGIFQTTYHFLTPSNLIQSTWLYQYGGHALGLTCTELGIIAAGLALLAGRSWRERSIVIFFIGVACVSALAHLESSQSVWQAIPLATMVQYPWRISLLIGLSLAIVVGSLPLSLTTLAERLAPRWLRSSRGVNILYAFVLCIVAGGIVLTATGDLGPQPVIFSNETQTLAQLARFETISGFVGTNTWGEYLPAGIELPNPIAHTTLEMSPSSKSDAEVELIQEGSTEKVYAVRTSQPFSLSLRALYFPDWRATIDGQPASVYPSTFLGLVTVNIPTGIHLVILSHGDTLSRQIGVLISSASLLIVLLASAIAIKRRTAETPILLSVLGLAFLVLALPAVIALTAQPSPTQRMRVDVSPELTLIGFGVENARYASDAWYVSDPQSVLNLRVDWQVKQPLQDKPFTWRLLDAAGSVVAVRKQLARYGTGIVETWLPNEIVDDRYDLPLGSTLKPGRYTAQVAYGESQAYVSIGMIVLQQPVPPPAKIEIGHPIEARLGDDIQLLGYDIPQVIQPGTFFPVTLYWKADRDIFQDSTALIALVDFDNRVITFLRYEGTQVFGLNPTSLWVPGETVVDRRFFRLANNLKPGLYRLAAGMGRLPNFERLPLVTDADVVPNDLVVLGEIKVLASGSPAQPEHPLDLAFGSMIKMIGYDLTAQDKQGNVVAKGDNQVPPQLILRRGQAVALQLDWQANNRMGTDYKVFVHVVDKTGKLVFQQDQFPGEWRYPTRIWQAGETIADLHVLALGNLPAGRYTIRVGLYADTSGERLSIADKAGHNFADDQIELGQIQIE